MKRVLASKAYDHGGKHEVMLGCKRKRPMTSHVHAFVHLCMRPPARAVSLCPDPQLHVRH